MEDISKYLRYAMLFPVIISFVVAFFMIPILQASGYTIETTDIIINGDYVWPTPGFTSISSSFGKRKSPTAGASSYHEGVDILAYQGTKVLSIADGKVIFAGWSSSGGYMVKIQHDSGMVSAYCHMDEIIKVNVGENVKAGENIGAVGPKILSNGKLNGATTGVHLHLAIYKNGQAINPLTCFTP